MFHFNRETKILSGVQVEPFFHQNVTAGQMALHYLQREPNKIIQVSYDDGVEISAGEMAKLGLRIAKNLLMEGLKFKDVIGIVAKNSTYVAPLVLASLLIGTPCNTLDPTFDEREISHIFKQTNPKIVFCDCDNWETVIEALKLCENDAEVWTVDEKMAGVRYVGELFELLQGEVEFVPRSFGTEAYKVPGVILCSSGTTGVSKGVILSHLHCIIMSRAWPQLNHPNFLCFSSLYWISGFTSLMQSLSANIKRVITKRPFRPLLMLHLIEQYRVNVVLSAPSHVAMLLKSPYLQLADLSSVRLYLVAGGFLDEALRKSMQDHLLYGALIVTYGMTEMAGLISLTPPFQMTSNSVGKIVPNMKLKIVDDDGNTMDINEIGEIYVMSAVRFLGYANNIQDTKNAFDNEGWFKTGDLGYINEDGDIYVVDRKKDMIKYLNYQVAPSELENFIVSIKGVMSVCVVGIPDMISGDLAAAVIVKDKNSDLTEQDVIDEVAGNFPQFKRLHGGAYFVDGMPLTPSGKIKKIEVRKQAARMYRSMEINGNY